MATYDDIERRIQALLGQVGVWQGIVYRNSSPRYAGTDELLTGTGASKGGGRWTPKGIRAVYASLTPQTCMAEALSHARYYGLSPSSLMPRVFAAVEVSLNSVLDLTVGMIRQRVGVSLRRMLEEDWHKVHGAGGEAITQWIGRGAMASGLEAIIVASAADPEGKNLVWFPDNLKPPSTIAILNADQLPT